MEFWSKRPLIQRILLAAGVGLIVGTAIALNVPGGPAVGGFPVLGLLGFGSSLVAGLWLLFLIWRSRS